MSSALVPSWTHPAPALTRLDAFRRYVNRTYNVRLQTYSDLHTWSVTDVPAYCESVWRFVGLVSSSLPTAVADGLDRMWPRPKWFPGARLNYTENVLARGLATCPDMVAVSACNEGETAWRHLTWRELRGEVERYSAAMRTAGVGVGDRVATVATNGIEALLLLLAAGSLGAVFSSTAPDMGAKGIVERYAQIQPKLLFVETAVLYGGKNLDMTKKFQEAVGELKKRVAGLQKVVVMNGPAWKENDVVGLDDFHNVAPLQLEYAQLPFDHPIYILYSSGTTGPPKCIVHGAGAALLQQKKDLILGADLNETSVYYQYTTVGWMMFNIVVAALSCGARVVLYDGSPLLPTPAYQMQIAEEQGVTHYGTSPKFLAALRHSLAGARLPPLESLQTVTATGAPLPVEICNWLYTLLPKRVSICSTSGGTDLAAGIVGGGPLNALYGPELASANLGIKVEIWDPEGKSIEDTGNKGDLVITKPFFSMPIAFWGEDGDEKYRKAYFDVFPGIWCHGDFISKNPATGGYVIHGRSDGVLNPGGVRFGTADLYNVLHKFAQLEDYIVVGQRRPTDKDERVILFVKMHGGKAFTDELKAAIAAAIKKDLSARHVPEFMLQVKDIPYTSNGKRIENLVRDTVCGDTAANPECLAEYEQYFHLPVVGSSGAKGMAKL